MMVWPQEKLRAIAQETAEKLDGQRAALEAELTRIQAEFDTARQALERADRFVPAIDGKVQCPRCWVEAGRESELTKIEGPAGRVDTYKCFGCKTTFPLTY